MSRRAIFLFGFACYFAGCMTIAVQAGHAGTIILGILAGVSMQSFANLNGAKSR